VRLFRIPGDPLNDDGELPCEILRSKADVFASSRTQQLRHVAGDYGLGRAGAASSPRGSGRGSGGSAARQRASLAGQGTLLRFRMYEQLTRMIGLAQPVPEADHEAPIRRLCATPPRVLDNGSRQP
jgi:hypothetical protein